MKRKTNKRSTSRGRRKNPTPLEVREVQGALRVIAEPKSALRSRVIVYYKGTVILDKEVSNADAKILTSPHGREKLAEKFAPILIQPRKNPSKQQTQTTKEEKVGAAVSIGEIKLDPRAAYRLGYRRGLLDGLDKCGIGDFFERQALRTQLSKALDQSLDELHERITSGAVIGRFPQIK